MGPDEKPRAKIWCLFHSTTDLGRQIELFRQTLAADLKPMGLMPVGAPQIEEADGNKLQLSWEVVNA